MMHRPSYDVRRDRFRHVVEVANPWDKPSGRWDRRQAFVFWFGACRPTYVLAYGRGLDDALEAAAEWLADNLPGLIMPAYGDEHNELLAEACEDAGLEWPMPDGVDEEPYYEAEERACADLTYTESGYLTSYEWGIALENPTPKQIADFVHGRD